MKHYIFLALGGLLFNTQSFSCSPGSQRPNLPPFPTCDFGSIVSKVDLQDFVAPDVRIGELSVEHSQDATVALAPQASSDYQQR